MALRAALPVALALLLLCSAMPAVALDGQEAEYEFPSRFDQRDLGIVTPPKEQGILLTCWAFSMVGAAETALLSYFGKTYEETGLDLSELHVSFFGNNHVRESTSVEQNGEGFYNGFDEDSTNFVGGYEAAAAQLFATGGGPVYESDYPYKNREGVTCLDKFEDREWLSEQLENAFFNRYGKTMKEGIDEGGQEERSQIFRDYQSTLEFPETVDEFNYTSEDIYETFYLNATEFYSVYNQYYDLADWTLDEGDRDQSIGYTLCDWNLMPGTWTKDNDGKWAGLNYEGMAAIKSELMDGRGMIAAYFCPDTSYSYLFISEITEANHSSQIIGWDDDIPAEAFSYTDDNGIVHQPEGNGAWLVKNSFGSETYGYEINGVTYYADAGFLDENGKHTGFYWLSYYDRSVMEFSSMTMTDRIAGDLGFMLYCHDYLPDSDDCIWKSDSVIRTANMFTGKSGDPLTYLSIYSSSENATVRVKIYMDPAEGEPETGRLVYDREFFYRFMGVHAIELDKPLAMYEGRQFSIVVEEFNEELGYVFSSNVMADKSHNRGIYGVAVINRGESFLYNDGVWNDWYDKVGDYAKDYPNRVFDNFWIKAYATMDSEKGNDPFYDAMLILIVAGAFASFVVTRRR